MIYDLHIHSKYSCDSILNPEKIIKLSKKKGLNGIAITDHNTIRGGKETLRINEDKDFQVILGSELKTEYGDVIGLFINDEILSRRFSHVLDDIKSQGGLAVLPHPCRGHKEIEQMIQKIDLVEGFNARSKSMENFRSSKLAENYNKPMTAGSDAHLSFEIGRGITIVNDDLEAELRMGRTEIRGKESNYYLSHGFSIIADKLKGSIQWMYR